LYDIYDGRIWNEFNGTKYNFFTAILKHFNTLGDLNEYIKNPSDQALFSSSTRGATKLFVFGSDFISGIAPTSSIYDDRIWN
jgi:hypothetical protein